MMTRAILTDIEGTTSSIRFVKEVLFPYAAEQLPDFLANHWQDEAVREQMRLLSEEAGETVESPEHANRILQQWIREDRKATSLKTLQGMIWRSGYENGDYEAHVYPDAAHQLRRWHERKLPLYVYSSGSVAAQKLFFRYSEAGDLSPLFKGYFDTRTGPKKEAESYQRIAGLIGVPAQDILFLSDVEAELDAARQAGMKTILLDRDRDAPPSSHPVARSFSAIEPGTGVI
jgi:enolase-phosphatase E1